jgi:hypothetical protein
MIAELMQIVLSGVLGEAARYLDLTFKIEIRERVFHFHHNILGLIFVISSVLLNANVFFFGSGLIVHHLIREGW